MKRIFTLLVIFFTLNMAFPQEIDTRVLNIGYWKEMASRGLVQGQEFLEPPSATFTGNMIFRENTREVNSPDIAITASDTVTQSENSVFVNPLDPNKVINSNNSTNWNDITVTLAYGADAFTSDDGGTNWQGQVEGAGGTNRGDPATAIDNDGRYYIGYIANNSGQGIAYSDDSGQSWTHSQVASGGDIRDKNHLWVDNSTGSQYEGRLYSAWTNLQRSSSNYSEIELSYSSNSGASWTIPQNISSEVNAGSHNQGVNIQTGPNGEVYALWAIYDSWPSDETAIGFVKSTDGGQTFSSATRIIENIRGVRSSGTSKNMRVNSFPVMAVDISSGPDQGNIYVIWSNIGIPGTNAGNDIDIYLIKSTDGGGNWSSSIRVNQDPSNLGKEHYFPWITCDPVTGDLHVIFYDDRNVNSTQCEVFVASSYDGGETWEDFKVSDVSFTPTPIPGLASSYFGDYLGISARNGKIYPVWTDNRSGVALAYTSPFNAKSITLANRHYGDPDSNLGGTLSLDNLEDDAQDFFDVDSDSDRVSVSINDQYSVRTNNFTLQGERHLLWNSNNEDYFLEKANFEMIEEIIDLGLNANFDFQDTVIISTDQPFALQFRDPWFLENPEADPEEWIQPNTFHILETSSYPVFLNQHPDQGPHYSLRAPRMVEDAGQWKIFHQWSGDSVIFPGGADSTTNLETPVVFTAADAEVVAEYIPLSELPANSTGTLLPDESLTIPPGSELNFPDGFTLQIEGDLTLDGNSEPIVLNALNNSWNGIVLGQPMNNNGSLFLNNVEINNAQTALTIYQENAELINLNEIQINDCATGIDLQDQSFSDTLRVEKFEFNNITSTAINYSIPWFNGGNIAVRNCSFNDVNNGISFHFLDDWGAWDGEEGYGLSLPSLEVSNCQFENISPSGAGISIEGYENSAMYWPLEADAPEDFEYNPGQRAYYFHDNTFSNNASGTGVKYIGNMPLFVEHCLFNNLDQGVDLSGIITCGDGVSAEYNRYLFANNSITKCTKGYDLHFDGCSSANRLIFSVMETTHSIFYGNTEDISITDGWGAAAVDQYSHFSQDADPQFVDFNGDDFHLTATSPCVDQVDWQDQGITYFDPVNRVTISEDPDGTPLDQGAFYYPQLTGTVTQDITLSGAATLGNETGDDVIIPAAYSLTVEPGTEVFVQPNTRLLVNGSLYIQGTQENPVSFTTEAGATWTGISMNGGVAEVDYCEVQSASGSAFGASDHTTGWIRNSNLHDNNKGLSLTNVGDDFEVRDNAIHHNQTGLFTHTSQADLIGNHVYENSQTGMLLTAGTNGFMADNEIDHNGNGVDFNSAGLYMISSSPIMSKSLLQSTLPRENNVIHDNNGFGIYSSFTGLPNLGTYQNHPPYISGGFNHFYNNSNTALYRNYNFSAHPGDPIEVPADYLSLMAEVNYWFPSLDDDTAPGDAEYHGSVHWYPVAATFSNGGTSDDYEHVALLGDGLIAEQDAEYEVAIDYYQQFLASDPPNKDQMIAAMSGMDRCYGHLKAVD